MQDNSQTSPALLKRRQRINEIDAGILALLHERMQLAIEVAEIKRETGKAIYDFKREEELFTMLKDKNDADLIPDEDVLLIWGKIIELSRKIQKRQK